MNISPNINSQYAQQSNYSVAPNFTSRNKILRELSDIGMLARREFPVYSSTKLERKSNYNGVYQLFKYASNLIDDIRGFIKYEGPKNKELIRIIDSLKRYRVGNCGELADAGYIACKMNGIKNAKLMSLAKYNVKTHDVTLIDHSVVGINFSEKSRVASKIKLPVYLHDNEGIIMDNWYGFVDYSSNATTQYKFDKVWGKTLKPDERFCYVDYSSLEKLTDKDLLYFEHTYPNLMKSKKMSLKDKVKWMFTDKKEFEFEPFRRSIKESHKRNAKLKNAMSQSEFSELVKQEVKESEKKASKAH